jgi:dipeptidyl aminopeptidase/acylaminoacyl peptidase
LLAIGKIAVGLLASSMVLALVGPVLGEVVACQPPFFPRESITPLTEWDIPFEDVSFATSGGLTLRGWFVPAKEPDAPAVFYAPATAHDQRSGLSLVPALHAAGYHVLLFSYRGHARSDGPSWGFTYGAGESYDVDAAVRFLFETRGIRRIAAIGHSAGAVSSIISAARNPRIGAVVAVAPYNDVAEVWQTSTPPVVPAFILEWSLRLAEKRKGFDRAEVYPVGVVDQIAPRPLLLIHGTRDRRITQEQALRMFDAACEPKSLWLVHGATHAGIRTPTLDDMMPGVIAFLDAALRPEDQQAVLPLPHPGKAIAAD